MRAVRPLSLLLLLGLGLGARAQGAPASPGKDTKPATAAPTAPGASDPAAAGEKSAPPDSPAAAESKAVGNGQSGEPAAAEAADAAASPAEARQAPASDNGLPGREGELVPQLPRLVGEEEVAWLEADGKRFFVFKRSPKPGPTVRGSLVIVPAPQAYIDQRALTRALREDPLIGGYHTFALQPSLVADATAQDQQPAPSPGQDAVDKAEAAPAADAAAPPEGTPSMDKPATEAVAVAGAEALCARLKAAVALAGTLEPRSVAIVAEQQHAAVALACFADGFPPQVQAFAAVGAWRGEWPKLGVPSIEFVPALDPAARREAMRRARASSPPDSPPRKQIEVDGQMDDAAIDIARRLRGWLNRLPSSAPKLEEKPKTVSG